MAKKTRTEPLTAEEKAKATSRRAAEQASRPLSVSVRFSQAELSALKSESDKTGKNYSDLIRSKVLGIKK